MTALPTPARATTIVLIIAAAIIAGAWAFELIGGLPPCPLCLRQRWAYYAAIPLLAAGAIIAMRTPQSGLLRALLGLAGLAILAGAVLAGYHAGIEWGWWAGPSGCSAARELGSGGSFLPDLNTARVIRCDEAAWRMFGISLAGYNALISAGLAALAVGAAMRGGAQGSSSVSQ